MKKMKRLFFGSDLHCGHVAGICPPAWHYKPRGAHPMIAALQRELWGFFTQELAKYNRFDAALWVGDMIDGKGQASGSTELLSADRHEQCEMAEAVCRAVPAETHRIVRGTGYHVGKEEDYEDVLARNLGAKISDQAWIEANGITFNLKHHLGGTSTPYGDGTPIRKEMIWGDIWVEMEAQPRANVTVRGHTHRCLIVDAVGPGNTPKYGVTMPALQAAFTKFGGRRCSGIVHFGFIVAEIPPEGDYIRWRKHILTVQATRPKVERL